MVHSQKECNEYFLFIKGNETLSWLLKLIFYIMKLFFSSYSVSLLSSHFSLVCGTCPFSTVINGNIHHIFVSFIGLVKLFEHYLQPAVPYYPSRVKCYPWHYGRWQAWKEDISSQTLNWLDWDKTSLSSFPSEIIWDMEFIEYLRHLREKRNGLW